MFFLGAVTDATPAVIDQPDSEDESLVELPVNSNTVKFKINTGVDITVMAQTAFSELPQRSELIPISPSKFLATT